MAEEQQVVILKEGSSADVNSSQNSDEVIVPIDEFEEQDNQSEVAPEAVPKKLNIKLLAIIGGGVFVGILLIVILALIFSGGKKEEKLPINPYAKVKKDEPPIPTTKFSRSKIENMISKANSLYENGNKFEALKLYENIAIYNESLSNYNLGVSQMNQGKFTEALNSFKSAISNKENADVSALNAAVCALYLDDNRLFRYYLDVARAFLTPESNSFEYYNALINYYKGYYIEALYILNNMKNTYYKGDASYLEAKIYSLFSQNEAAIKSLESAKNYNLDLSLGLLNARLGKYEEAKKYLNSVSEDNVNSLNAKLATALIDMRLNRFGSAARQLKEIDDVNKSAVADIYPIKTKLRAEFFDIIGAQASFDVNSFLTQNNIYETLFYFTPYKVFNAKQTMDYIRKGGISSYIDEGGGDEYLKASGAISKVNLNMSKAIEIALNNDIRDANKAFLALANEYSSHSIVHFNLALTFAKLGDFASAYKYFIRSYHLNPSDYLAGVYAAMCAEMVGRDNVKLIAEIMENMGADQNQIRNNLYESMIFLLRKNTGALNRFIEEDNSQKPLNLAFDLIIANLLDRDQITKQKGTDLIKSMPNDIMAHILDFIANNKSDNIKDYARDVQVKFFNTKVDKNVLYGGIHIVRLNYVKLLQIAGLIDVQRNEIISDLKLNKKAAEALAYIDLFALNYDEAYQIYNDLIYKDKINDANTLFLAAVASIGSARPQSAIAYLEFAKITNPTDLGNRIVLGMLYHETKNIPAAINQYSSVGNTEYRSEFFTFDLAR